ncbi:MAG TPA: DUF362 domain-containing protein [Candidatus Lokiarchaeia archaeon]|nr:DUF362 domain-containing protein [Candidatus Lokiarchaeia archaeon]
MTGTSDVFFAPEKIKHLEAENTLPAKFGRMLDKAGIADLVRGKKVCIKMHLGGNIGYTTIHPLFVRVLVDKIKKSGARSVFVTDGGTRGAEIRGYTRKAIGCPIKAEFGPMKKTVNVPINYKTFDTADIAKLVLDANVLIVFSHVKGHGDCGFGGAGKNIAMGTTPGSTRGKIHALEGGIKWDETKCKHCDKCIEECPNKANKFDEKTRKYQVNWHDCKYCRHCILACPEGALTTQGATFDDFQEGMARVIKHVLDHFGKEKVLFINVLKQITIFCDCWGFSTPSLVPDIGILASKDLVAIDRASLDMIKEENLLPDGLPEDRTLGDGNHLFEKIHGKNPYLLGDILESLENGSTKYDVVEIE